MNTISTLRLNLLRVFYLVLVVGIGLGMHVWSNMIFQVYSMQLDSGTVICMLFALSVLSILGLRYPLKMLPVLFWELTWKASWLLSVALPHWLRGQWSTDLGTTTFDVGMIVIFVPLVPWSYVFDQFVKKPGDPWWRRSTAKPVDA
ncbi:MAG TPA: hypothetical protein VMJ93_05560 [Verrucomicrobiae bacterium]|nr:hypothetical protein [Verrucomicrobiae bacterium]